MRSNFVLLVGLSAVFVFLGIYGTSFVNGQTSTNNNSEENETGSASSVLQTDNLDPFKSKTSSDNVNENNPSQAGADTSANSNNDDTSIANDDSSDNNNNDDSSDNNNNNDSDKDDSADDNSSDEEKESKDDRKFELPFP